MASRHGLLLVQLACLSFSNPVLAVYHPFTGSGARRIPPSPLHFRSCVVVAGFALFAGEDCDTSAATGPEQRRTSSSFQVLVTAVQEDEDKRRRRPVRPLVLLRPSVTGAWSAPVRCHPALASLTMSGPRAAAIARGTAQWLYRDEECYYTLGVGADASRVSLTKIPIGVNS
jgi:hypothetical protein